MCLAVYITVTWDIVSWLRKGSISYPFVVLRRIDMGKELKDFSHGFCIQMLSNERNTILNSAMLPAAIKHQKDKKQNLACCENRNT